MKLKLKNAIIVLHLIQAKEGVFIPGEERRLESIHECRYLIKPNK
jgi:hypothetical protein